MQFSKSKLKTIRDAVQYAVMYAKTESETAEFALLLPEIETAIVQEQQKEERLEKLKPLEGCVFKYCAYNPRCVNVCQCKSSPEE